MILDFANTSKIAKFSAVIEKRLAEANIKDIQNIQLPDVFINGYVAETQKTYENSLDQTTDQQSLWQKI